MPLFDFYIMVDWSGGASRRGGRDTIWIAHGPRIADVPLTCNPYSRTEAVHLIRSLLLEEVSSKRRVLLCFDFAYGYPRDFVSALQAATGKSDGVLPWMVLWRYLSEHIKDDQETAPNGKPSNRSNRFEVASRINARLSVDAKAAPGPFWCASPKGAYPLIPQKRPPELFRTKQGFVVNGRRLTDDRARSDSPFRLFGHGSVGSQSVTGIARLHQLRTDPKLGAVSAAWPFETGWAIKANWLPKHVLVVHAEIYPKKSLPDDIKDRGQVRAMWQWARDLDNENLLWRQFCRPNEVENGSKEDLAIQLTEGWILGCPSSVTNQ